MTGLIARFMSVALLGPHELGRWQELAIAAGERTNPFLEPWYLQVALSRFDEHGRARLLVAADEDGNWHGLTVCAPSLWLGRMPFANYAGWQHANQFVGTPLMRDGSEDASWQAFLCALDSASATRLGFTLPTVPTDDPAIAALSSYCARTGRRFDVVRRRSRAMLQDDSVPPSAKRLARLASQHRRLDRDHGCRFDVLTEQAHVDRWAEEFLALEQSGWKGKEGSALACDPRTRALFISAMRDGVAAGRLRAHALRIGDRAIAMTTFLVCGGRAYGFKTCYDETFAAFAPGLLLLREVMVTFDRPVAFDSCTTSSNAAIEEMWQDRREIIDVCVAIGRKRRWAFAFSMWLNGLWAAGKRRRASA